VVEVDAHARTAEHLQPFLGSGPVAVVMDLNTARVAGDAVDVQLAVDAAFTVDVEDERTHARGFVRGTGDPTRYSCKVENVDSRDEVEIGDLLVTSGKGKRFPKGLPVARVTKVLKREPGRDQEIEAVPTVNFSRLDEVLVMAVGDADRPNCRPTSARPRGNTPATTPATTPPAAAPARR
jgi:hypothetical protein